MFLFDGLHRVLGGLLKLLLQSGDERSGLGHRGLGRNFANGGLQFLLGFLDEVGHLLCQRGRGIGEPYDGQDAKVGYGQCRQFGGWDFGLALLREWEPIMLGKGNAPEIAGDLEFNADLEEFPDRARALNPSDARAHRAWLTIRLGVRNLQGDPHIFQDIVLGLVPAAVTTHDDGGGAFLKRAAECVYAGDGHRDCLGDSRTTTFLRLKLGVSSGVGHNVTSPITQTARP